MKKPTESELKILQILWNNGESSVRVVNDLLNEDRVVGYTTTLKTLQIMLEKGLVDRKANGRSHLYMAKLNEKSAQQNLIQKMMDTAFNGSAMKLVMQALGQAKTSPEELAELKAFIQELEDKK